MIKRQNLAFSRYLTSVTPLTVLSTLVFLGACGQQPQQQGSQQPRQQGLEVKFLVGSDLAQFCQQAATKLNQSQPKLASGEAFYLSCEAKGSGDVVQTILSLAQQYQNGTLKADAPEFPTLLSVDGEIYQSQLIYQMNKLFPGQNYIPEITDSPLIAYSPMVLMTTAELAKGLEKVEDTFVALAKLDNYRQLDPNAPPLPITYVHTAPTRS
ncbi:MAG: Mg-chelatase subunit ChlD, partial [Microcystis sp.]